MINTYETLFICPGEITQEKADTIVEKVKSVISKDEGKIGTTEMWGRRRLAYPIRKHRDGFYIYIMFSANEKAPQSLNQHYRVTDSILKGLIVKVDPRHIEKIRPVQRTESTPTSAPSAPVVSQTPAAPKAPQETNVSESKL
jgi:small subunit ribosomal protein S6